MFRCIACDHTGDADVIGAQKIRQRALAAPSRRCRPTPPDGYGGVNAPPAALSTCGVGGGTTRS